MEAVEAAVDALIASKLGDHPGINGEEFVEAAQAALEAAAPYMLAEAWDEGYDRAESDHYGTGFWATRLHGNPYRRPTK